MLSSRDALGRDEIAWKLVILELLDDSTGSLPTLRGIILQDAKSATYKLALLRALTIIADRSASFARDEGEDVLVPLHLWIALRRLAVWIEPVLLAEWVEQMRRFARSTGKNVSTEAAARALRWIDPERDTREVRRLCELLDAQGKPIHCVWTDKRLSLDELQVDHCFPWASWPCDDLWNLMPASREANQAKRDKLITAGLLERKRDRIAA